MTTTIKTHTTKASFLENPKLAGMTEFDIAVAAKGGDADAWMGLWNRYCPVILSIFGCILGMGLEEKESEAYDLFAHKLSLFDPNKIGVSPNSWTFSFMITGGAKNRRDRLINESRLKGYLQDNEYVEFSTGAESGSRDYESLNTVTHVPEQETNKYSVETLFIKSQQESETARVKRLYANLNNFQKDVLRLRRAGYLIREIAQELDCSLSRVKDNLREAKLIASHVFEVEYA